MNHFLLVTPDSAFQAQVKRAFDGELQTDRWWSADLLTQDADEAADTIAHNPSPVVVLGPGMDARRALEVAAALDRRHPTRCAVLVARLTPRLWELAVRAGVRDVVSPGATDAELVDAFRRALDTAGRRTGAESPQPDATSRGRVITVLSPKGGSGKTTVATNLALALARSAPGRVAIVDLDLQFGDVGSALQLNPEATLADAARATVDLDGTALKVFLEPHPSKLYALCAPHTPAEAEEIGVDMVGTVIDLLAREFDHVVVDTSAGLDEYALVAAERSADLVLVCATDVPAVRGMRKALDALELLGMTGPRRHLLLNRADARVGLAVRDIEAIVGTPFDVAVPSSRIVPISLNQGSPVVESEPRSPVARSLLGLADRFYPGASPVGAQGHRTRKDRR